MSVKYQQDVLFALDDVQWSEMGGAGLPQQAPGIPQTLWPEQWLAGCCQIKTMPVTDWR